MTDSIYGLSTYLWEVPGLASDIWADAGYFGKAEMLVTAVPLVIWGVGAAEESIRCAWRALQLAYSYTGSVEEEQLEAWMQFKQESKVAGACLLLTGLSAPSLLCNLVPFPYWIPLKIPSYYSSIHAYAAIDDQASYYSQFKYKLEPAETRASAREASTLAERLLASLPTEDELETMEREVRNDLRHGTTVTQSDLDQSARQLSGTLIYRNYSYTVTYYAVKTGLEKGQEGLSFAYRTAKRIFSSGLVRRFCYFTRDQLVAEVQYTLLLTDPSTNKEE